MKVFPATKKENASTQEGNPALKFSTNINGIVTAHAGFGDQYPFTFVLYS